MLAIKRLRSCQCQERRRILTRGVYKMAKEIRKIAKNLNKSDSKKKVAKIKWKSDHRGIKYDKKTGIVTAT